MRSPTVWLGLVVSAVCLGAFVWNADWPAIGAAFVAADPLLVAGAVVGMLASLVGRAWRWRALFGAEHPTTFRHRLTTTAIGFMGNALFPGRIGEPLRAFLLARLAPQVSFAGAIATLVVERLFDILAMLTGLLVFLSSSAPPAGAGEGGALLRRIAFFGWIFGGLLLAAVGALLLVSIVPARVTSTLFARVLPDGLATRVEALVGAFRSGLASLWSAAALTRTLGFTAVVWAAILASHYCMMQAFGFHDLGVVEALGLLVVLCFAVALPQAPGYLGVFQIASEATLTGLYDVPVARAKAFAIALWAAQQLPMIAAGMAALWVEGLSLGEMRAASRGSPPGGTPAGDA